MIEITNNFMLKAGSFVVAVVLSATMTSCSFEESQKPTITENAKVIMVMDEGEGDLYDPRSEYYLLSKHGIKILDNVDFDNHKYEYVIDITKAYPKVGYVDTNLYLYESYVKQAFSSEKVDEEAGIAQHLYKYFYPSPLANRIILDERIIIPDCYSHYFANYTNEGPKANLSIYDKMKWFYSEKILVTEGFEDFKLVYSRVEVKEDVLDYAQTEYCNADSKRLDVGDVMESYSLYMIYGDEEIFVGFVQTGAGSDCQNVQDKISDNFSTIITTVEKAGIIEDLVTMSANDFLQLRSNLGNCEINDSGVVVTSATNKKLVLGNKNNSN